MIAHFAAAGSGGAGSGTAMTAIFETDLPGLELIGRGKVRDIYAAGDEHLLIVATDRLSAFDVVLPDPIPGKGAVLTGLSRFWFSRIDDIVRNHCATAGIEEFVADGGLRASIADQTMVVRRLEPLPIEAIVRGYLIGSGWKDYQRTGTVCGIRLPAGLRQADRLPEVIFTPSTKAEAGAHDENIDFDAAAGLVGRELAERVREASIRVYREAAEFAAERGIIIADTKFEFALDADGELVLIDEVLTPDSSRFWPADRYAPGTSPPSFDKQFVRDYLETLDWDKTPPAPALPAEIIDQTAQVPRGVRPARGPRLPAGPPDHRVIQHVAQVHSRGVRPARGSHAACRIAKPSDRLRPPGVIDRARSAVCVGRISRRRNPTSNPHLRPCFMSDYAALIRPTGLLRATYV